MKGSVKFEPRYLHMSWCLKNDIRIYLKPIDNIRGQIIIVDKGVPYASEEFFRLDDKLWRKKKVKGEPLQKTYSQRIYELYTIKYNENHE